MMTQQVARPWSAIACIALAFSLMGLSNATAAESPVDASREAMFQQILDSYAGALVRVKFVQKTQSRWGEYEAETEVNAVMIEPTGLIMCSNTLMGGGGGRWGGRSVPTDIKILIGDDTEGIEATFIARDTELDLAWLQIKEPGDRKFTYLDLSAAKDAPVEPKLGQTVVAMGVMGKYFGQETLLSEGYVAGRTKKPRRLYVTRGGLDTDPGLPVFTAGGDIVGFASIQRPDEDEVGGAQSNLTRRGSGLLLPTATVLKAIDRAKDILEAEQAEEAAAEKTEEQTEAEER